MTTTIQNFYKKGSELMDTSEDYKVITMPAETYQQLIYTLMDARYNGTNKQRAQEILNILDEAASKDKGYWY